MTRIKSLALAALLVGSTPIPSAAETLHYTSGGNMVNGEFIPGPVGFNLADVSSVSNTSRLPEGVKALVYVPSSLGCGGNTDGFRAFIDPYKAVESKLWGFYVVDEPYVLGYGSRAPCPPANLLAETNYIHHAMPGVKTFMKMGNSGSQARPNYSSYTPANSGVDVFSVGSYLCRSDFLGKPGTEDGCDWTMIDRYVDEAERYIAPSHLAPTYQTFAGWKTETADGVFLMPTAAQEQRILKTWHKRLPNPEVEYAYAWACQDRSTDCLSRDAGLQAVFAEWFANRNTDPVPEPEPPKPEEPGAPCVPCCVHP